MEKEDLKEATMEAKDDIARTIRAVAHKQRLEILASLIDRKLAFVDLLHSTKVSRTALANHLSQLTSRGLVERVERGWYQITIDGREMLQAIVQSYIGTQIRVSNERRRMMERYAKMRRGMGRMKKLEELKFKPHWVSHLGCLDGCLQYLGIDVSTPWLYGGTGHAFIINISKDSCPSGPTAWKTEMLFKLGRNLGYAIDGLFAFKSMPDFEEKRKLAWEHIKESIDEGHPCYGWEIGKIADFYIIYGYDDIGYYYKGYFQEDGAGPKPWDEVGESEIGLIEIYSVRPGKSSSDEKTVKDALEFAIEHSKGPESWIFPNYSSGLAGYDTWISGIEDGIASVEGLGYNAAVWGECRHYAVEFLKEAKERLKKLDDELDEAIKHYSVAAENMKKLTKIYPFSSPTDFSKTVKDKEKRAKAVSYLMSVREAEESGLQSLNKIIKGLNL